MQRQRAIDKRYEEEREEKKIQSNSLSKTYQLTSDAFILPQERKDQIPTDFKALYGDQDVCKNFSKKDATTRRQFVKQFKTLLIAFKNYGKANECSDPYSEQYIEKCSNTFFQAHYSGNQTDEYFTTIKQNLENILFILTLDTTIPLTKKKKLFKHLCNSMSVCAPGLYTHIEDVFHDLTTEISLERWLTELRTNVVRLFAEQHLATYEIDEGNSIHVYNAFLIYALNEGWNVFSKVNKSIDVFASTNTDIIETDLEELSAHFYKAYSPQAILDCVCTNLNSEISHLKNKLAIKDDKEGWMPYSSEFIKATTGIIKAIGMKENDVNFFDLTEDGKSIRFNSMLFRAAFLKSCRENKRLFDKDMWVDASLVDDYKLYRLASDIIHCKHQMFYWENNDNEIINWQKSPDAFKILGAILAKTNREHWKAIIRQSIAPHFTTLSTLEAATLLSQISEKSDIKLLIKDYLPGIRFESALDICHLIDSMGEEKWKADCVFDSQMRMSKHEKILPADWKLNVLAKLTESVKRGEANAIHRIINMDRFKPSKTDIAKLFEIAIQIGQVDVVRALAKTSFLADVDVRGETLAHIAVKYNQPKVIHLLNEFKIDLNHRNKEGTTPVLLAAKESNSKMLKILAECKADLNPHQKRGGSAPIHIATRKNDIEIMQLLCEYKADLNLKTKTKDGLTAAFIAVRDSHLEACEILLKFNANFEKPNSNGKIPLRYAINEELWDVVCAILNIPSLETHGQKHPAIIAAESGNINTFKKLKENKIKWLINENSTGNSVVHIAAINGDADLIALFAEWGADLTTGNKEGLTPLFLAVKYGRLNVINTFAEHKVSFDKADDHGKTAIYLAAEFNHPDVIKFLWESNVDLNQYVKNGETAAHIAARCGHADIIKMLKKCDADLNKFQDNHLMASPTRQAVKAKHYNVLKALAECKANLELADKDGNTPAHFAVVDSNLDAIKLFATDGVNFNILNDAKQTPLQLALDKNHCYAATIMLLSMRHNYHISEHDKSLLFQNRDALTDTFIDLVKDYGQVSGMRDLILQVIQGKNALGVFLNTPYNRFVNFFTSKARYGMTDKIYQIAQELKCFPDGKESEQKEEVKTATYS